MKCMCIIVCFKRLGTSVLMFSLRIFQKIGLHCQTLGNVWNCLWGHALKRTTVIIRKNRVLYPGSEFLSSGIWPLLPKKHYNGLINQPLIKSYISFQNKCF